MSAAVRIHSSELVSHSGRVVARLSLPGFGISSAYSRSAEIIARILAMDPKELASVAKGLITDFSGRHDDLEKLFSDNAHAVSSTSVGALTLDRNQTIVVGAAFTAEVAVEGAALCNPSAFEHPDQTGLNKGEYRVALSLRAIGEGHVSSIEFAEAVIREGDGWRFENRALPLVTATITSGRWTHDHLRTTLEHEKKLSETSSAILGLLPDSFTSAEAEVALNAIPAELTSYRDSRVSLEDIRTMTSSAYEATFPETSDLSQRVLMPVAAEERNGVEDARFVRVIDDHGVAEYRATYTAYDGSAISSRLIVSKDLRKFEVHRLTGKAASHKGMALFPRKVGGEQLSLTRTGGENISIARSPDGLRWSHETTIYAPTEAWEVVQSGNCGSPIETERGWLVLTHGVGPFRVYSIGAILLDLDDPTKVIARCTAPILRSDGDRQNGYVPNVVYTCGGIVHKGTLWIPFGVGDNRVSVGSVRVDELLDSMVAVE